MMTYSAPGRGAYQAVVTGHMSSYPTNHRTFDAAFGLSRSARPD
jgi:hypothetical protein